MSTGPGEARASLGLPLDPLPATTIAAAVTTALLQRGSTGQPREAPREAVLERAALLDRVMLEAAGRLHDAPGAVGRRQVVGAALLDGDEVASSALGHRLGLEGAALVAAGVAGRRGELEVQACWAAQRAGVRVLVEAGALVAAVEAQPGARARVAA